MVFVKFTFGIGRLSDSEPQSSAHSASLRATTSL